MAEPNAALTLQLLEWIAARPRTYDEVLEAWRSTCPRLTIWEDACIDGLIDCDKSAGRIVALSSKGLALIRTQSKDVQMPKAPEPTPGTVTPRAKE